MKREAEAALEEAPPAKKQAINGSSSQHQSDFRAELFAEQEKRQEEYSSSEP